MREDFLQKPSFLQSAGWERLQNSLDRKTWKVDGVLLIQHRLPFALNYLYCPRPQAVGDIFLAGAEKIAAQEQSIFLKVDLTYALSAPCGLDPSSQIGQRISMNHKCQKSSSLQPPKTVVLDLQQTEEELFAKMHEKTRYNIRLAEKHGVVVRNLKSLADGYEVFWRLLQETAKRDNFFTHHKDYYKKLLETRSSDFFNELFFAEYQGKILATALVNFYRSSTSTDPTGGVATYLHGASTRENREVMASHSLHWQIIREAKKRRFSYYDFWGIDEIKWSGVTRFKLGFGGDVIEYLPTVDIIYRPVWYKIYQQVKKLRI